MTNAVHRAAAANDLGIFCYRLYGPWRHEQTTVQHPQPSNDTIQPSHGILKPDSKLTAFTALPRSNSRPTESLHQFMAFQRPSKLPLRSLRPSQALQRSKQANTAEYNTDNCSIDPRACIELQQDCGSSAAFQPLKWPP
eukprot:Gb_20554 [translate_table: standard]